jgi:tripartite-type tricarboxylate transporter receptor subunit TctC
MLAPAKTPPAIIQRMNAEVTKILRDPAMRDRLTGLGMNIQASSPEELGRFIDGQMTRWAKVVKDFGIRAGD